MRIQSLASCLAILLALLLVAEPAVFARQSSTYDARSHLAAAGKGKRVIVSFQDGTVEEGKLATLGTESFTLDQGPQRGIHSFVYAKVVQVQNSPNTRQRRGIVLAVLIAIPIVLFGIVLAIYESHKASPPAQPPVPVFAR